MLAISQSTGDADLVFDGLYFMCVFLPIAAVCLLFLALAWENATRTVCTRHTTVHQLSELSPYLVLLLSVLTFGFFYVIHYGLVHGRLPLNRKNDPKPGWAIGLAFIPFFGTLYWLPFVFLRLVVRINEQLVLRNCPRSTAHRAFVSAFALAIFNLAPLLSLATGIPMGGLVVLVSVTQVLQAIFFLGGVVTLQMAINNVVHASDSHDQIASDSRNAQSFDSNLRQMWIDDKRPAMPEAAAIGVVQ